MQFAAFGSYLLYLCQRWALTAPFYKGLDGFLRALRFGIDTAIGLIANKARQPQLFGPATSRGSVVDALYAPPNVYV